MRWDIFKHAHPCKVIQCDTPKGITIVCFHPYIIIVIYYNFNSILLANNSIYHTKAKHIEVHYHFVEEKVLTKKIDLVHVDTKDQVVNIFTKALGINKLWKFRSVLGVLDVTLNLNNIVEKSNSTT